MVHSTVIYRHNVPITSRASRAAERINLASDAKRSILFAFRTVSVATMDMNMSDTSNDMDMGEMGDSHMVMTFFSSSTTSLFSKSWTPASSAAYAGTCIFLIIFAVIMRIMLALKPILEKTLWNTIVRPEGELIPEDETGYQKDEMTARPAVKRVYGNVRRRWAAWRFKTSLSRAFFELLLATVGYLLYVSA
ncbi:hypothetical protein F5Y13DRAFT_168052 [Hypoxylon sp. FL1857]|nr:hypothetical protein F5Y13DRAFT_168052 [Hypoxylon sp. FL1857]